MKTLCALTIAACTTVALSQSAAALAEENDALDLQHAKISLSDAVQAAETKAGGHAARAEFDKTKQGWVYDVEVVNGSTVSDVRVNAETGAVESVTSDKADKGEGEGNEED